uniref:Uncharacterized protein n=1 Tax=Nelumbo nucifera TaxID=4432 RepID=A0A822Z3S4_NELNU|nr:TPA_asm: hypothetical protein HUJ06_013613 [Nelumbo nucifera]
MKSIVLVCVLLISVLFPPTEVGARLFVEKSLLEMAVKSVTVHPARPVCGKGNRPYTSCIPPRNKPPKCRSIYGCRSSTPPSP